MSNTTLSADLIQASIVLPIMDKCMFVLIYISGFFGALLNIFIFRQKRLRIKSCSTYFLANSIVDFCYINSYVLVQVISLFNREIGILINSTNLWCKTGNYLYFLLPCLASTYITLASIDRFCVSSSNAILQNISQSKISYILTLILFFIWSLFALHIPISYARIQPISTSSIRCTPQLNVATIFIIIDGYFFVLYNGIIVPILLIIFGLLILRNVKLLHQRILPQPSLSTTIFAVNQQTNPFLTRGNRHLITMLLFQVSLTIFLYIPYIVIYLYGIYNSSPTDSLPLLLYAVFSYLGRWFWNVNFCKTFYINLLSSQTFRKIFTRRIIQFVISNNQQNALHQSIPHQSNSESTEDSN